MKRKGFTLIELIVVIAIIGILATIILIALGGLTPRAKKSAAIESLNRSIDAVHACVAADETVNSFSTFENPSAVICYKKGTTTISPLVAGKWPGPITDYTYNVAVSSGGVVTFTPNIFGPDDQKITCGVSGCQ